MMQTRGGQGLSLKRSDHVKLMKALVPYSWPATAQAFEFFPAALHSSGSKELPIIRKFQAFALVIESSTLRRRSGCPA